MKITAAQNSLNTLNKSEISEIKTEPYKGLNKPDKTGLKRAENEPPQEAGPAKPCSQTPKEQPLTAEGGAEGKQALLNSLKSYASVLSPSLLKQAFEIFNKLKASGLHTLNAQTAAFLAAKNLPLSAADIVKAYIGGSLKFSALFSSLSKEALTQIKNAFEQKELEKNLISLIKNGFSGGEIKKTLSSKNIKEIADNLMFQELITKRSGSESENALYFQWPLFYGGFELPDTLEGEAHYPADGSKKQGFTLRLLLNPPYLGHLEIALNKFEGALWVHFGAEKDSIEPIKGIFGVLQKNLLKDEIKSVKLTISQIRLLDNFFCVERPLKQGLSAQSGIDLRV